MADDRSVETVRREIGAERQRLASALDDLRGEAAVARRKVGRRARNAVLFLVAVTGAAAAARMLVRRFRD